jgi:hypothetical protein
MPTSSVFRLRTAAQGALALLCAALWQTGTAQTATAPPSNLASDPAAKVPAVEYRSVFKETSLGVEKEQTDWRKANDEVGKFTRGHIDILKWEEQEAAKAMKAQADKSMVQPAVSKASPGAPAPANAGSTPATPNAAKPAAAAAHKH